MLLSTHFLFKWRAGGLKAQLDAQLILSQCKRAARFRQFGAMFVLVLYLRLILLGCQGINSGRLMVGHEGVKKCGVARLQTWQVAPPPTPT